MPYLWVDEVEKVQTISADGIGMYPDDTNKEIETVGVASRGRRMEKIPSEYYTYTSLGSTTQPSDPVVS